LKSVSELTRAQGDDPDEIVASLRAHVQQEIERQGLEYISPEWINRVISDLGSPEEIANVEAHPRQRQDDRFTVPGITPQSVPTEVVPDLPGSRTCTFIWVFCISLGAFSLVFELLTGAMANIWRDPVPTPLHLIALVMILASLVLSDRFLKPNSALRSRRLFGAVLILNGFAVFVAGLYTLAYLFVLPIAVLCLLGMGLGLMGFAPLFCFLGTLSQMRWLYRNHSVLRVSGLWTMKRTLAGVACALCLGSFVEGPRIAAERALHMAISKDSNLKERGIRWIKVLGAEDQVLQRCYVVRPARGTRFRDESENQSETVREYRSLYYRLTGDPFNSVPKPKTTRAPSFLFPERDWTEDWDAETVADSEVGGSAVAGRVRGLSLYSSALDVNLSGDEDGTAGPSVAYMEWTLQFQNDSAREREARAQIRLPHNAVCSRLTLWVDGEEREAAFGKRAQVREAYKDVAVVQRRDPALITTTSPDSILLQCFPIPPEQRMKVKIGITAPLEIRLGEALLSLPHFSERNFTILPDFKHSVWIECPSPYETRSQQRVSDNAAVSTNQILLTDQEMQDPSHSVLRLSRPPLGKVFLEGQACLTFRQLPSADKSNAKVCIVLDGSSRMGEVLINWSRILNAFVPGTQFAAVCSGPEVSVWSEGFSTDTSALLAWLSGRTFEGGCDPVPALGRAWDICPSEGELCFILWVHAPDPVELSSSDSLMQRLARRPASENSGVRLLSVPVLPGPRRLEEALGDLSSLERISVLDSVQETLEFAAANLAAEDVVRVHEDASAHVDLIASPSAEIGHIGRLAGYEQVRRLARLGGPSNTEQAQETGIRLRLVTPVTGAVVLEKQSQYDDHGLDPGANEESIPAIPEPEEWVLIIVAALATIYLIYRRRCGMREGVPA